MILEVFANCNDSMNLFFSLQLNCAYFSSWVFTFSPRFLQVKVKQQLFNMTQQKHTDKEEVNVEKEERTHRKKGKILKETRERQKELGEEKVR